MLFLVSRIGARRDDIIHRSSFILVDRQTHAKRKVILQLDPEPASEELEHPLCWLATVSPNTIQGFSRCSSLPHYANTFTTGSWLRICHLSKVIAVHLPREISWG